MQYNASLVFSRSQITTVPAFLLAAVIAGCVHLAVDVLCKWGADFFWWADEAVLPEVG